MHHPDYEPLYATIEPLGIILVVHESTTGTMPTAGIARFDNFFCAHRFSHPCKQQLAFASILAGGVLERHPNLRLACLETGTPEYPPGCTIRNWRCVRLSEKMLCGSIGWMTNRRWPSVDAVRKDCATPQNARWRRTRAGGHRMFPFHP